MIRNAINRILELAKPNTVEYGGNLYVDKELHRVDTDIRAETLQLSTLTSLVEYVKEWLVVPKGEERQYFIHIASPTRVDIVSALDGDKKRETLVSAVADIPRIPFNQYIDNEQLLISLQSCFVYAEDTDTALVLRFAGTVTSGSIAEYGDDGVTQKATIKQGVASKAEAIVPSPCVLKPYRTFIEAEQPSSKFVFRMREGGRNNVESSLYEADGGAWKNVAKENIKKFLVENLEGTNIIILA